MQRFHLATSHNPTVLIAEDHPAMLQTVSRVISPHFKVVSAVSDGRAALDMAAKANPGLIVLDIRMPGMDGFRTARELTLRKSPSKIVFLTAQDDDDYISEALNLGARGYVTKRRLHSDLVPALHLALDDRYFVSPHAFVGVPTSEATQHVLQLYPDEITFLRQVSDLTYAALRNNELVFMFLNKAGIGFVAKRLRQQGLNYREAIRSGRYWVLSTEGVLSAVQGDNPAPLNVEALFRSCMKRATARSKDDDCKLTIFSDLMTTLLRQGCDYEVAARVETAWNELIPKRACTVYCACPISQLAVRSNREALARLCPEHSEVTTIIATDRGPGPPLRAANS